MVRGWWLICAVLAGAGACTVTNAEFAPGLRDAGTDGAAPARDTPGPSSDVPGPLLDAGGPDDGAPPDSPPFEGGTEASADMTAAVDGVPDVAADLPPPVAGGPALHWRFDEPGGMTALDSSGNGWNGIYTGVSTAPTPTADVPPTKFPNPYSRFFAPSGRPGVFLRDPPAALQPDNGFTLSAWFRATTVPTGGGDLINMDGDYVLRVRATALEFVKRTSTTSGMLYTTLTLPSANHLDDQWHHVAGVSSTAGVVLYLDGMSIGGDARGENVVHKASELSVGRLGTSTIHDFRGTLDEVRIYTSPLAPAQVSALAAGFP
jgi:hypothetical protein